MIPAEDLTAKTAKDAKENQKTDLVLPKYEELFKTSRSLRASRFDAFTQHDLTSRAADYFRQARKPRAEWKKLDDLSAQLAEFDLRCAAEDYDTACSVLKSIDYEYLLTWGHYRFLIDLHMRIKDKITDKNLRMGNLNGLGFSHYGTGKFKESVDFYQQGLNIAHESDDSGWETTFLGNLGNAYSNLGETHKSIEFYEQALLIARNIRNRSFEGSHLGNLGILYGEIGETKRAITYEKEALKIARELMEEDSKGRCLENLSKLLIDENLLDDAIKAIQESLSNEVIDPQIGSENHRTLALAFLYSGDLQTSERIIGKAIEYDFPPNNHNASALHGIIALRQGDASAARGAFVRAIGQADEILSKTAEYYDALDAKGLAICGLILAGRGDPSMPTEANDGKTVPPDKVTVSAGRVPYGHDIVPTVDDAIETFQKARKIAPHAGVVKSVLRLFDELVKCEGGEILKDVREVIAGS